MKTLAITCFLIVTCATLMRAGESGGKGVNPGAGANVEIATGLMGSLS